MSSATLDPDMPIDNRKDLLLLVLAAGGEPVVGVTRLQKYLFLLQHEHHWDVTYGISQPYEFEAYDYGPFDSQLYDDLEFLENLELVERHPAGQEPSAENDEMRHLSWEWGTSDPEFQPWEEETAVQEYRVTDRGRGFAEELTLRDEDRIVLEDLKQTWNQRPLNELLRWLYETYPEYAEKTRLRHLLG